MNRMQRSLTHRQTEFFESKGVLGGLPIIFQGIFEEGECVAVKVLDEDGYPLSWAFDKHSPGGPKTNTLEGFRKTIQRLYDNDKGDRCG